MRTAARKTAIADERPEDELTPAQAGAALHEALLSARLRSRVGKLLYAGTLHAVVAQRMGGTIVVDAELLDGKSITFRIAVAKAHWLVDRLTAALEAK